MLGLRFRGPGIRGFKVYLGQDIFPLPRATMASIARALYTNPLGSTFGRLGCRVQGSWGAGFRVQGAGCRVHGVQGLGFRVQTSGLRVQGL